MQQHPTHPPNRGTPSRRRQNRHSTHSPTTKSYASESDMPTDLPFPIEISNGVPFTPQKSASNSPAPASQQVHSKSKPRTGNKSKPKNVSTSPGPAKNGRTTPPYTAGPKSGTAAAFAGATFHASPAPSSLPMPSFLLKAMGSPRAKDSGNVSQEPSPPPTDTEAPTPRHQASTSAVRREESPLDVFFRADRAEKERARGASSANAMISAIGPFSPPPMSQLTDRSNTAPRPPATNPPRRPLPAPRSAGSGISTAELDGTPGRPMGPAFSTPYQERIKAMRSNEKSASLGSDPVKSPTDRSEALKNLLGVKPPSAVVGSPTTGSSTSSMSTAYTTSSTVESRSPDLLFMERHLREVLKLDGAVKMGAPPTSYRSS